MASSDPTKPPRPGPWPRAPEPNSMPSSSWAKRTGFKAKLSGETTASDSGQIVRLQKPKATNAQADLESGQNRPPPSANGEPENEKMLASSDRDQTEKKREAEAAARSAGPGPNGKARADPPLLPPKFGRNEEVIDVLPQSIGDEGFVARHSHLKYELRDNPGVVPISLYGFQHYISMLGSLILIPLVIVPAMGGSHEDTSMVVSTTLFVSGVTTLLHTFFGSRLPLIQGPSFVYLAPALAIINSPQFLGLNGNTCSDVV